MAATKAPTGLSTSRKNLTFTFTWKIADKDYGAGQQLQYRTNQTGAGKWINVTIGHATISKSVTLDEDLFYPYQEDRLKHVTFRVRGKRKPYDETRYKDTTHYEPDWSAWASKTYSVLEPSRPSLEAELTNSNTTVFSWETEDKEKSNKILTNVQYQTMLVKDCKETDGSKFKWHSAKPGWDSGTTGANGSKTCEEDTTILTDASWTRWIRVRSRGPRDASAWRYGKHVYATPYKAVISSAKATVKSSATTVTVKWTVASNAAHPIDSTTVEYLMAVPGTGLSVPAGASWTEGNVSDDTAGKDAAKFTIGSALDANQCLWVRVVTKHDANEQYSTPKLVLCGKLTAPTDLSVTDIDDTTYRATVSATNGSSVPDSRLAVAFAKKGWSKPIVLGIIAHGDSSVTVQCPSWSSRSDISFSVYAFQGKASRILKNSVYRYAITANMQSVTLKDGGDVPTAPESLEAEISETTSGEVILTWDWSWKEADSAEISWSQNPNAWESTAEPQTYTITNVNAAKWRVSGLETGSKWYFRVRLAVESAEGELSYGPYSDTTEVDLSSAPAMPVLILSAAVAAKGNTITASWGYVSTDNTGQAYAEICKATISGGTVTYGSVIAHANTEQHLDIKLTGNKWQTGNTYNLCVRVTSESGHVSEWSDPVPVQIADPVVCEITQTSLLSITTVNDYNPSVTTEVTGEGDLAVNAEEFCDMEGYAEGEYEFTVLNGVWFYDGDEIYPEDYGIVSNIENASVVITLALDPTTETVTALTSMPLDVYVEGAGDGGTITLIVERAAEYHMIRPDGFTTDGYEGETIALVRRNGDGLLRVKGSLLIGLFDDGAPYRLIATIEDSLGQKDETSIDFEVRWSHQALIPGGTAEKEGLITKITPIAPRGTGSTDTCDIYRLSADKPELIVEAGSFGTVYVDPYPAIGEGKGHRIVFKTLNGDYITADNQPAWLDIIEEAVIDEYSIIIDFDGRQLLLPYNIALSNKWDKDFKVTPYLGGSQQGDWNPIVSRTATYNVTLLADEDADTIEGMRLLADYHGICHIRTPEGSSFAGNIDVSENKGHSEWDVVNYTLTVTKTDPEKLDGQTYEEWINHGLE